MIYVFVWDDFDVLDVFSGFEDLMENVFGDVGVEVIYVKGFFVGFGSGMMGEGVIVCGRDDFIFVVVV